MSDVHGPVEPSPDTVSRHGPNVCNQPLLVLPDTVMDRATEGQLHALKIVQLEFARDVSAAATKAYETLIAVFGEKG